MREGGEVSAAEAFAPPWVLRPYQTQAIRAVAKAWGEGNDRTMIVLATGTGKTTCFAEVIRRRRDAGRGRALVLAHRSELITQAADRLDLGGISYQIEQADQMAHRHSLYGMSDAVVATVQTLRGKRLAAWPMDAFGTIVVDEAHHVAAAGYRAILDHFGAAKVLGVTATPDRGDGVAVGHVIPHMAYSYGIREGIADGYLCPLRYVEIPSASLDLSTCRLTNQEHGRDFSAEDIAKQVKNDATLLEIASPIAKECEGRQVLAFMPTVETAHELARVLAGLIGAGNVASLDATSDRSTRAETLAAYQAGRIRVLVNCALFTEGFDAPATSAVVIARPTRSRALFAQMVGRGTRIAPGKADCLILNLVPQSRHSLVSPVDLMDGEPLPDDVRAEVDFAIRNGEDVLSAVSRGEEVAKDRAEKRAREQRQSIAVADARYTRREVDLFAEAIGLPMSERDADGPRATERQAQVLTNAAGFKDAANLSRREASRLLDELSRRRKAGLCTMKQARQLAKAGLKTELTFAQASEVMTMLAANRWRMSPEIAERFGNDSNP